MEKAQEDLTRNLIIAGTAIIPVVGGPLSFLLDKYLPSQLEQKRNLYLKQLSEEIDRLKEKIDIHNFETPEFQSIFMTLLRHAIAEYREEKIDAFKNLTLSVAMDPNCFNKVDFYSRLVIIMIPDEIRIIKFTYALDADPEFQKLDNPAEDRKLAEIISNYWNVEQDYITSLLMDCMRYGLLTGAKNMEKEKGRGGIFITSMGVDFLTYIGNPEENFDGTTE